jgi:hypothetical protein
MTRWHWPMMQEPPMVPPPKKVRPIGPELPPPLDPTMPIPTDLLTPLPDEPVPAAL